MSEFNHLMEVFCGPMGGTSHVVVTCAGACYGKDALTIKYNNQVLIVNMVELEKTIAIIRKHHELIETEQ